MMNRMGFAFKTVAVVGMLTFGSTAVAPEARAAGAVRAVTEWVQVHSVEVSCIIGAIRVVATGEPSGAVNCLIKIFGAIVRPQRTISAGRQSRSEPIVFDSLDAYLAHPLVSKEDRQLVNSRYLPALKQLESDIQLEIKRSPVSLSGKRASPDQIKARAISASQPAVAKAKAPLEKSGIKVQVRIK